MIRSQGPLRAYSARSMERSIQKLKKMIKSKVKAGSNASNIVERNVLYTFTRALLKQSDRRDLTDFRVLPNDEDNNGPQLWEPFANRNIDESSEMIEGVEKKKILKALRRHYSRLGFGRVIDEEIDEKIECAARLWKNSWVFSSLMYRRIRREESRGNHYVMFMSKYRQ